MDETPFETSWVNINMQEAQVARDPPFRLTASRGEDADRSRKTMPRDPAVLDLATLLSPCHIDTQDIFRRPQILGQRIAVTPVRYGYPGWQLNRTGELRSSCIQCAANGLQIWRGHADLPSVTSKWANT